MVHESMDKRVILYIVIVLVIASAAGIHLARQGGEGGGLLIAVTYPSLARDLRQITCIDDRVIELYPPGSDPHDLQLDPSKARIVMEADVIVTGGHTPVDKSAVELARGVIVDMTRVEGVRLKRINGGQVNIHYPIYDPGNYRAFLESIVDTLSRLRPECSETYRGNLAKVLDMLAKISRYNNTLNNTIAVIDLPSTQYPVEWLGVEVKLTLSQGQGHLGESTDPKRLDTARRLLEKGAIAVITVDDNGNPVSKQGEWLLNQAREKGSKIIRVKAPYTNGTVIEKLEYIISQIRQQADNMVKP